MIHGSAAGTGWRHYIHSANQCVGDAFCFSGQVTSPLLQALLQTTAANLSDSAFLSSAHVDLLMVVEVRQLQEIVNLNLNMRMCD